MLDTGMAVNDSQTASAAVAGAPGTDRGMSSDRYCRHCHEIALAYDPGVDAARCRSCGELA
jgi:hypothetical protein